MFKTRAKRSLFSCLLAVFLLLVSASPGVAAPRYVQAPPLTQVVRTAVGPVKPGLTQVPLITWGGDIPTILANGGARVTQKGSVFERNGLDLRLVREDNFIKQVEDYISGKTPYLRGTLGMINMAIEVLSRDPRTVPVPIYQISWSAGGDALVAKKGIDKVRDLKGRTIALQAYGPHVDYLSKVLESGNLSLADVKLKWLPDLTGTENTPMYAFFEKDVDAALVIIPDALAMTSGSGAEYSVSGSKILLSTKTADHIIADLYFVRSDYLQSNGREVEKFVHGLLKAEEEFKRLVANKSAQAAQYRQLMGAAAEILLDSPQATADAEALVGDMRMVGYTGNVDFFNNPNYQRNLARLASEIQTGLIKSGLLSKKYTFQVPGWDYAKLKDGLLDTAKSEAPKFDSSKVANVVTKKQQQGRLESDALVSFEVTFQPNQALFSATQYGPYFDKVVDFASTYGGAIITVEGHSDPLEYLRKKKNGELAFVLNKYEQSLTNLSARRAIEVRDALIGYAKGKGVSLDPSQFAVVGHGIRQPKTGMCGNDPCPPKSKEEWLSNMRVEFRLLAVESEATEFKPL